MPGKFEIMRAVRDGLNSLEVDILECDTVWTNNRGQVRSGTTL